MNKEVIPTVGVLIIEDNKILLVRHGEGASHLNDVYGLPAGRINEEESEIEAAQRELKEETGLDVDVENLIEIPKIWHATIERKDGIKDFSFKVFVVDSYRGELKESSETVPEWINIVDLDKYNLLPNMEDIIEQGLMQKNKSDE